MLVTIVTTVTTAGAIVTVVSDCHRVDMMDDWRGNQCQDRANKSVVTVGANVTRAMAEIAFFKRFCSMIAECVVP
jgi:hypothetical protein